MTLDQGRATALQHVSSGISWLSGYLGITPDMLVMAAYDFERAARCLRSAADEAKAANDKAAAAAVAPVAAE